MTPAFVLIGTPCYGGLVTHVYMQSMLKLMLAPPEPGLRFGLIMSAHDSLITRSRNAIEADVGIDESARVTSIRTDRKTTSYTRRSPLRGLMLTVIVKMFERFLRKFVVLFRPTPWLPHTSSFVPDAAIGGEIRAVTTLDGVTWGKLTPNKLAACPA